MNPSKSFLLADIGHVTRFDDEHLMVAGNECVVLHHRYDRDQLWLDFGTTFFFYCAPISDAPQRNNSRKQIKNRKPNDDQRSRWQRCYVYPAVEGEDQLPLPFREFRKLTKTSHRVFREAKYAGWERLPDGKSIGFHLPRDTTRTEVARWVDENFSGLYYMSNATIRIQKAEDASLFRLRFDVEYLLSD